MSTPLDLGQPPLRSEPTVLDRGLTLNRLWVGAGSPGLEVCEVTVAGEATASALRRAWERRRAGRPVPVVIVVAGAGDTVRICGPEGAPPPLSEMSTSIASEVLGRALSLDASEVVPGVLALLARAQGSGGVPGLRNRQLLSTHVLTEMLPRRDPTTWAAWQAKAAATRAKAGRELLSALGYRLVEAEPLELVCLAGDRPVALTHLYPEGTNLDRIRAGTGAPPAAQLLAAARRQGLSRAFLCAGPVLRLYSTDPAEELEESVAPAAFLEVETHLLPKERSALLWACCSAESLQPGGAFDSLVQDSARFAVGLRDRFRDRVYTEVVPALVRGLAAATRGSAFHDPDALLRAALTLLFRLLFVLYAEDRNLLPVENPYYRLHSVTAMLHQVRGIAEDPGRAFDARASDLWDGLTQVFAAVRDGHREWEIPPYDGGLFVDSPGSDAGRLLAGAHLPNAVLGPALYALAFDRDAEGAGKVDFGDLGVRHIGTIYEGLLKYQVAIAEVDLTVDRHDPNEAYRTAAPGEPIHVRSGEPYLLAPHGGRKLTGSYYTPAFVVDRLVRRALGPVLERHLAELRGRSEAAAAVQLFDIRVCDPAMGSGHFLVQALDELTARLADVLAERHLLHVSEELEQARAQITAIGRAYGAEGLGERVGDVDLLRRLVLKRCIYGVDLNPMAVELARLSLWLHAFVPGLPLGYLGHTLRQGNALVGVSGPDMEGKIEDVGPGPLWNAPLRAALEGPLNEARAIGGVPDLRLDEVEESRRRQERLEGETAGLRQFFNLYTASAFEEGVALETLFSQGDPDQLMAGQLPRSWHGWATFSDEFADEQAALHWQLAFPEVFLRERPGFDVILANPPWEEVTVEQLGFYTRYLPGLKSERSHEEQERRIAAYVASHPDAAARYEDEARRAGEMRGYLGAHYRLTQSGDPDLYKAFAERFLQLCRSGGAIGVVLPRSAFAADGTAPFRKALFTSGPRVELDFLLNSGRWIFDMEPRYTIALCVAQPTPGEHDALVSTAGPAADREAFERLDSERVEWRASELAKLSDGLEVPLIPGHAAGELFHRLCAAHPPFRAAAGGFQVVPWRELDMTNDLKSGLLREHGPGWPVYSGDSFDLWKPDHMKPPFVLPPKEGLAELQRKRQRSSLWRRHFPASVLRDSKTLPQHDARILFRDVTNRTNSRTVIACLVPPRVFAVNKAPSLLFPKGDASDVAYVLGVMASLPFDWCARRRVETNLNFFILEPLPLPRPARDDPRRRRVVELAGRLACPDERFAAFASAVGVEYGAIGEAAKVEMIAELDATVALLYGCSEADVRLMLEDFPVTEAAISAARRERILRYMSQGVTG